jgi:hypothetical protein|eukprot:COSAG01_NODE_36258_length_520_cov_0.802850_1_plen_50_part_00
MWIGQGSAAEAAMKALQEKHVSTKVNYSTLQNLFGGASRVDTSGAQHMP